MYKKPTFTSSHFATSPSELPQATKEPIPFQLEDFLSASTKNRGFVYDSESARNFDQSNVVKAKEGVKEVMADALLKAQARATEIKAQAQKEGYNVGYADGFKKGEDDAKQEFSPFLITIQGLIEDLSRFRLKMYPKVEREMVAMVIGLTKKVIHYELSTREDSVQEMIQLAVGSVLDKESMIIKIHPDDKGYAETFRPELHHIFKEIKNITFEAHSGISRGGCMIETNFGVVDARLEKLDEQIDKILNLAPPPIEGDLPDHEALSSERRSSPLPTEETSPETTAPSGEEPQPLPPEES